MALVFEVRIVKLLLDIGPRTSCFGSGGVDDNERVHVMLRRLQEILLVSHRSAFAATINVSLSLLRDSQHILGVLCVSAVLSCVSWYFVDRTFRT